MNLRKIYRTINEEFDDENIYIDLDSADRSSLEFDFAIDLVEDEEDYTLFFYTKFLNEGEIEITCEVGKTEATDDDYALVKKFNSKSKHFVASIIKGEYSRGGKYFDCMYFTLNAAIDGLESEDEIYDAFYSLFDDVNSESIRDILTEMVDYSIKD